MTAAERKVIGLTGGIASGKSFVASLLKDDGYAVIDADQLSRKAVEPGSPALHEIKELFGDSIITPEGALNRAEMRRLIFGDAVKRKKLESILHPEIRRLATNAITEAFAGGCSTVFYMAPLLIEAGAISMVDEVWLVAINKETQLSRVMERDGIAEEDAVKILSSQMSLEEKKKYAAELIDNNGSRENTKTELMKLLERKQYKP